MNHWELIYNVTPCYFFSFSNSGQITRINDTLLNDLQYERDEVVNIVRLEELLTVGSRIFFQTHFYPLIKMQGNANEIYLSFRSKTNKELPVLLNVTTEKNGADFEIHCGGMQITQRNRFEKELLEAKNVAEKALLENDELIQLKKQFELNQQLLERQLKDLNRVNNEHYQIDKVLSHDLQEPLRKIGMFTSMLLEKSDSEDPQTEKIEKIGTSVDKIRNLIDSMQKFHALEHREFTYTKIDLRAIANIAKRRSETQPHIEFHGEPFPEFLADSELITSLFQELITNAVKFTTPEKKCIIKISASEVMHNIFSEIDHKYAYREFVRITFTDNGSGFKNEYAEQAFNLFNKLHPNAGLGIGLSFCRKIVHLHSGKISVSSNPGIGSTFTILLPTNRHESVV